MWYLTRYVYRFFIALAVVGAILSIHWGSRTTTTQEPIKELMRSAATKFAELLATESSTYPEAVAIYSRRRGRHPPPGFAEWYAMANATNAVMIEAFWDQIYKDLAPFWNITPEIVRSRAAGLTGPRINHLIVKEHQAHGDCEEQNVNCYALLGMIKSLAYALPDIDIPFNSHVSPRVFVPWEDRTDPQAGQGTPFSAWNTGKKPVLYDVILAGTKPAQKPLFRYKSKQPVPQSLLQEASTGTWRIPGITVPIPVLPDATHTTASCPTRASPKISAHSQTSCTSTAL